MSTFINRRYKENNNKISTFSLNKQHNYLFELNYQSVIEVTGENAESFLQGQMSCDIRQVRENKIVHGAFCNLKGRVLALADVVKWGNNYQLILPDDLKEASINSLAKTALLSRVQINPHQDCFVFGFILNNETHHNPLDIKPMPAFHSHMQKDYLIYSLGDSRYILLLQSSARDFIDKEFKDSPYYLSEADWHCNQLAHQCIEIYPETRGKFLPHRLDLHLTGYLSFDKGCYKGQEIVARTHYKATLKHSLKLFNILTKFPAPIGSRLLDVNTKQEIGELIDAAEITANQYMIAVSILNTHPTECIIESTNEKVALIS